MTSSMAPLLYFFHSRHRDVMCALPFLVPASGAMALKVAQVPSTADEANSGGCGTKAFHHHHLAATTVPTSPTSNKKAVGVGMDNNLKEVRKNILADNIRRALVLGPVPLRQKLGFSNCWGSNPDHTPRECLHGAGQDGGGQLGEAGDSGEQGGSG